MQNAQILVLKNIKIDSVSLRRIIFSNYLDFFMNFFKKDKLNLLFSGNSNIESTYKNFSELSVEEITSIKKIKLENFKYSETKNSFELNIIDHRSYHFLILQNEKLIAYSRLVPPSSNFRNLTLERFCVANAYKGRGISRILIKYVIDEAANLFPKEVLSLSSLEDTKLFYEKFGFSTNYFTHDENGNLHYFMTRKFR